MKDSDRDRAKPPHSANAKSAPRTKGTKGNGAGADEELEQTNTIVATGQMATPGPGSALDLRVAPVGLARGLAAFKHRDFSLFWSSQLISLIGTWMQILGQGWLVLQIGGSAFELGVVSALQFIPTLILSLFGGLLADHFPKRTLLLATQSSATILAFVLAIMTWNGTIDIPRIMVLAVLLGTVNAVDMPTRQAFIIEMVGREDMPNAIALNSALFNGARLVGPAIAGVLIGWLGLGIVFFLNGVSFLPVLAALWAMQAGKKALSESKIKPGNVFHNIKEGLDYVWRSPIALQTTIIVSIVAIFGMNFSVVAPVLARNVLHVGADGYGLLLAAMGVGSLIASVLLAFMRWKAHINLLAIAAIAFGLLEIVLSGIADFSEAALLLAMIGFAMIVVVTVANTTLQTVTPDRLRGRVMSVYVTVFVGTSPIGSLFTGSLANVGGIGLPLAVGGAISVAAAACGWWLIEMKR